MVRWFKTSFENWTFRHTGPLKPNVPTILALHGFSGTGLDFSLLAEDSAHAASYLWIAPDLPGHGATGTLERSAYSLSGMSQTLLLFLNRYGLNPHLLGYSMGGRLALHLSTLDAPVQTCTVIGAHPGIASMAEREARAQSDRLLAAHIRKVGIKKFADEWEANPIIRSQSRIPQEALLGLQNGRRKQSPEGLAKSLEEAGTGVMSPLLPQLKPLQKPLLYVTGSEDEKFYKLSKILEEEEVITKLITLPHAGHCAHLENSRAFLSEFFKFIEYS